MILYIAVAKVLGATIYYTDCYSYYQLRIFDFFVMYIVFFFFFFFQAEDGIRDHCVTGVQTCALPILMRIAWRTVGSIITRVWADVDALGDRLDGLTRIGIDEISYKRGHRYVTVVRSEERRVGKECRCRGSTYHEKKNRKDEMN